MSLRVRDSKKQAEPRRHARRNDVVELCDEIMESTPTEVVLEPGALEVLRKTSKEFVSKLTQDARLVAAHCGRDSVTAKDIELVLRLRET